MEPNVFIHTIRTQIQSPIQTVFEACEFLEQDQGVVQNDGLKEWVEHICNACRYILEVFDKIFPVMEKLSLSDKTETENEGNWVSTYAAILLSDLRSPTSMILGCAECILKFETVTDYQQVVVNKIQVEARSVRTALDEFLIPVIRSEL